MSKKAKTLTEKFGPRASSHPLGGADADKEIDLVSYFVDYDELVGPIRNGLPGMFIHLGEKGTGKSALQRIIKARESLYDQRVLVLRPEDIELWSLARSSDLTTIEGISDEWLNRMLWTYLIAVEVFKQEYDATSFAGAIKSVWNHDLSSIRKLLDVSLDQEKEKVTLAESFKELAAVLKAEVSVADAASVTVSANPEAVEALRHQKSQSKENVLSLLRSLVQKSGDILNHEYLLLIDDLDLEWSNTPQHRKLLEGLLQATRQLSRMKTYSFVVALRQDIYRELKPRDRDKIRQSTVVLTWTEGRLFRLLEARVGWAVDGAKAAGEIADVFEPHACEEICRVAVGNPRRAIEIAEASIVESRRAGLTHVSMECVSNTISTLSREFLIDLDSQYNHTYPGLLKVADCFRGSRAEFPFSDMELVCVKLGEVADKEHGEWILHLDDDPNALATLLAQIGFLLYKKGRDSTAETFKAGQHLDENCWLAIAHVYRPAVGVH